MSILEIGCCGAYCATCKVFLAKACAGCKLGYEEGGRDLCLAKCQIKVCCIQKTQSTCADCKEYESCAKLQNFYGKNGYKYGKYRQATEHIKSNGYTSFLEIADTWKNAYGKYKINR